MPPATPRTLLCAQSLCLIVLLLQGVCKNREDKAEIPCNSCTRTFPTRRHLQEHRRAKHRDEREESLPTAPQNMGHSVGQYFSSVARVPAPRPQLPPFSCPAPPPPPRCEVCHAIFPSELALSRHFPTHWPSPTTHHGEMQQGATKVTGNDLPLPLPHHHEQEHSPTHANNIWRDAGTPSRGIGGVFRVNLGRPRGEWGEWVSFGAA